MAEAKQATYRAKKFGRRLRDLREDANLSIEEAVEALRSVLAQTGSRWKRVSRATLSRLELGNTEIESDDLTPLMDIYGVKDRRERLQLRQLAQTVRLRGWHEGMVSDQDFADYVWAETDATAISSYQIAYYPGQIQDPEFAEVLVRHGERRSTPAEIESFLEVRLTRAELLSKPNAPKSRFLLYEGVLRQRLRIFTNGHYARQYRYLQGVATYPNVEIRYLPFNTDCPTLGDVNAGFTILTLPEGWPTLAHIDTPWGAVVGESPGIDSAVDAFESLWHEGAQSSEKTMEFLDEMLKEVEK